VVDGGSADRTAEIGERFARVIRSAACRAVQMNQGARSASAEILLFLHADVLPGDGTLEAMRRALEDPDPGPAPGRRVPAPAVEVVPEG